MSSTNFNDLSTIYSKDVLEKLKNFIFHIKQAVDWEMRAFEKNLDKFKKLGYGLLYATTPKTYENAVKLFEGFAVMMQK